MKIFREKIVEAVTYQGDIEITYLNINEYQCFITLPVSVLIDTEDAEKVSVRINDGYLLLNDKCLDVYDILRLKRKYEEEEDEE